MIGGVNHVALTRECAQQLGTGRGQETFGEGDLILPQDMHHVQIMQQHARTPYFAIPSNGCCTDSSNDDLPLLC